MRRKSCERVKDAYSIPHPVPPKITPRARIVPATAPISLLVATLTVQEKRSIITTLLKKQTAGFCVRVKDEEKPRRCPPPLFTSLLPVGK